MKIELKKETNMKGDVVYWTYIDGQFVSGSCSTDLEIAEKIYEGIKKSRGKKDIVEVLKSETL